MLAALDAEECWDIVIIGGGATGQRLHPELPYTRGEVVWAARHEMARSVEEVLSRRTRVLLLDVRASITAAPQTTCCRQRLAVDQLTPRRRSPSLGS